MIEFENVVKKYGDTTAIQKVNLKVNEGELFGLIGPDGAGKTTMMRILTTLLLPDSGKVYFNGNDVEKEYKYVRQNVGYMPGTFSLYEDLSVLENLNFFASIFNTSVIESKSIIEDVYFMLEPFSNRKAGDLSGGMKQKLALCCALIHKPLVLVLDEPTTGVDAVSRREFWQVLKGLKAKGMTIFVSTPYMDEASLCERVALIQNGVILNLNSPENIIKSFKKPLYSMEGQVSPSLLHNLRQSAVVRNAFPFGDAIHITLHDGKTKLELEESLNHFNRENNGGYLINEFTATIEDCFMDLMTDHE